MVKKTSLFLITIILVLSSLAYGNKDLVYDEALLFNDGQRKDLEDRLNKFSDYYNMDVLIVTTNNAQGKTSRDFADDFFDYNGFGRGEDRDGVLLLIDMDNREIYISTSGRAIDELTDSRLDNILDHVFTRDLNMGEYYEGSLEFIKATEKYFKGNTISFLDILIGLVGGGSAGGLFFASTKSSYRTKTMNNPYSFRNNSLVNLGITNDRLVDKQLTSRIIPRTTNRGSSSGRSTRHTSSSGRTHGGRGRKF